MRGRRTFEVRTNPVGSDTLRQNHHAPRNLPPDEDIRGVDAVLLSDLDDLRLKEGEVSDKEESKGGKGRTTGSVS
jgi:hypothetical protein